jgi:hypothetical protein
MSESREAREELDEGVRGSNEVTGGILLGGGGNSIVVILSEGNETGDQGGLGEML